MIVFMIENQHYLSNETLIKSLQLEMKKKDIDKYENLVHLRIKYQLYLFRKKKRCKFSVYIE